MIKDIFVTVFIADIHFGAVKSDVLYHELTERFLKVINNKRIDMIVFGGDLFHNIITMNYSTSHIVLLFMRNVFDICEKNNIKYVRIIQGTMSHDNNQLHNFHIFEKETSVDFKIILSVQEETLPEGIRILYLPEEYMKNPSEYYREYLEDVNKRYDFIFGHGMVEEVAFVAKSQESENTMSKAPVFKSKQLINACRGPVYFGHIHTRTQVRDHLHYPGSFTRWRHGEEADKGFFLSMYSVKEHKYRHEFVVNDLAPTYLTVNISPGQEYVENPDKIVQRIKEVPADNIRIIFEVPDNLDCTYAIQYLTEVYRNNSKVKFMTKNTKELQREVEEEEIYRKIFDKYSFVFDKSLTKSEVIQKFIKVKKGRDVPIEIIKDELTGTEID